MLITIARAWMQHKRSVTEECIKMTWYIYTTEYYSAIKMKAIVPSAAAWMDLKIILSEVSQIEKDKYMVSLICRI